MGDHWARTGLTNLQIDMHPCNTALYLNGGTVKTPCGDKRLD